MTRRPDHVCDGNPCTCPAAHPDYETVWANPDATLIERLETHRGDGLCPDTVNGWDARDPACRACDLIDRVADAVGHPDAPAGTWPDWLTPEWASIHTTVANAIKDGTQHVYDSSDAAGLPWTADGMLSCQASAVLGALRRTGWRPPDPIPPEPDPAPDPRSCGYDDEPPDATFVGVDGVTREAFLVYDVDNDWRPIALPPNYGPAPVVWTEADGWVEVSRDTWAQLRDRFGGTA